MGLAIVFDGQPGQLRKQLIEAPRPEGAEILIAVEACTLCGSDLHSLEGRRQVPVPTVLGHEIVGRIIEFGSTAPRVDWRGTALAVGDRVTWAIVASCGDCFFCQRGLPQKCQHGVKYGHEALRPGYELRGGLAQECLLAPGTALFRLSEKLPLSVVCPASCATATVAAALESAGDDLRDRDVLVLGAGMLGLTACAMLSASGASSVSSVDVSVERRDLAQQFGAANCVDACDRIALQDGGELRSNSLPTKPTGFDVVLDFTGSPQAMADALPHLRIGGVCVLVGAVFPTDPLSVLPEQIVRRQLTLRGIHNYAPRHLDRAVEFLTQQHASFPFESLVSEWHSLDAIPDVLASHPTAIRIGVRCA